MTATVFIPLSENMRQRMNAIEALPPDAIALFRVGSTYEAYCKNALRIHETFKLLNRLNAFGALYRRNGITATATSIYTIHTLIAILQTEGITNIHVAEDGLNLRTVRAWLAV